MDVMMHLTCTNNVKEDIYEALAQCKAHGTNFIRFNKILTFKREFDES